MCWNVILDLFEQIIDPFSPPITEIWYTTLLKCLYVLYAGETLQDERVNGGAFVGTDGLQFPQKLIPVCFRVFGIAYLVVLFLFALCWKMIQQFDDPVHICLHHFSCIICYIRILPSDSICLCMRTSLLTSCWLTCHKILAILVAILVSLFLRWVSCSWNILRSYDSPIGDLEARFIMSFCNFPGVYSGLFTLSSPLCRTQGCVSMEVLNIIAQWLSFVLLLGEPNALLLHVKKLSMLAELRIFMMEQTTQGIDAVLVHSWIYSLNQNSLWIFVTFLLHVFYISALWHFRTACVIAVTKARDTFEPFLHQVMNFRAIVDGFLLCCF